MSIKPTNIPKYHLRKSADSAGNISRHCKLGAVTENIRTFALPNEVYPYTFKMGFLYDSWNRIQSMTYPDGEVVTYGYNQGGMLKSVVGNKNGVFSDYIKEIHYNKYELKDTVSYGNGTGVRYMYDSLLRLSHLRSACADGTMQDIVYTYDSVSNITGIVNSAAMLPNGLGGAYSSSYEYDNLYRLTNAEGSWQGLYNLSFQTGMGYFANGRVKEKNLAVRRLLNGHSDTVNYARSYYYENPVQRNTLTRVVCFGSTGDYDLHYSWTSAGNMDTCDTEGAGSRRLCWDEQNRLQGVKDKRWLSYYQYDATGDRTYKLTGKGSLQNISGEWRFFYNLENATLYASPYLVATNKGYTKHYYAETERICSKIGGGMLSNLDHPIVGLEKFQEKKESTIEHFVRVIKDCSHTKYFDAQPPLYNLLNWCDSLQPETNCYWYHPDHLGSSSWITYTDGRAVQHLHYLPWGEDFVNQRTSSFSSMYTFSAKEKDAETGYSYFGSRYYSSDLSIWLSVDPMSDKYPSMSPYIYCANNPVKLVDPNGEEVWIPGVDEKGNVTYTAEKGDSYDTFISQFDCRGVDGKYKGREIFANAKLDSHAPVVKEGTVIGGDAVNLATNSEVLKCNWNWQGITNTQKAAQLIFAIRYSACKGDWCFDLRDFVNGFQIGGGGFNFSASNVPDGNGGFIQIHNISVGCTYDNTMMTTGLFWNEDSRVNRDIYSTHNIYNNSPGQRPMIMFTLDKGNENSERFSRMVRCK